MPDQETHELSIRLQSGEQTTACLYGAAALATAARRPAAVILAHGAGAGQRHPFLTSFARGLSRRGLDVLTFDFFYMEQRRRVPDRMPQLVACYDAVIAAARDRLPSARERLFIGGKSMGGRAATHVVASDPSASISGLVLLGYPLHPPGRPDKPRDAHLPHVGRPMLFVQGSRDTFGTASELEPVLAGLTPVPTLHRIDGGDHSFKVAGRDAKTRQARVYEEVQDAIVEWVDSI